MSAPMLFPVESHTGGSYHPTPRTVAMFFDSSSAIDFINADERTLFLGEPRYDRRPRGYRPQERDWRAEYREWTAGVDRTALTEVEHLGPGRVMA